MSASVTKRDLEAILDGLSEGILTLDDQGTVIGINQAGSDILEVSKEEAVQAGCPCLLGDELCDTGSVLRSSIRDRQPIKNLEVEIQTPSGRKKAIVMDTLVLRDGHSQARGGIVVFRDVSELVTLRKDCAHRYQLHNIVGKSKPMQEIFRFVDQIADSDATVLIEGESGTGKELVARAIHYLSPRQNGPFIPVNCAALAETLLESELFGHVRGAFTGAMRDRQGRFEAASGGTIFLDEIGDVAAQIQVKLLRVLQERKIERVGSEATIPVDFRVIAATNQPLGELVSRGTFRQDLYYRLRVVPILLPPLRQRREDIPLLAQHLVDRLRDDTGRDIEEIDEDALVLLLDYHWPGNVRELENVIEYAFVKARWGRIGPAHFPPELHPKNAVPAPTTGPVRRRTRRPDVTPAAVRDALVATDWNIAKSARCLGISRTTLYKRMVEFQLLPPQV